LSAADPTSADLLPIGTSLGRYEIKRVLGRGGMGAVYEAVHRDLKKRVAIKTLLPSLAANPEARIRFLREGEAASRIRHPNVVDVTDVGTEGSTTYLVMEFLDGEDLSNMIGRQGTLTPTETADIMLPVAAAIQTAHDQGVIHRDLKPANVFLAKSAMGSLQPKVLDFGISKVMGDRGTMVLTGTGATFGTTFYLPPEQLQSSRQADAKSDQYALGTILYECVTGERAFEHDNLYTILKNIAEGRYPPPRSRRPDLPAAMEALIVRSMNLDPNTRYGSVKEMGAALLEFASPQARVMWSSFFGNAPASQPSSAFPYGMAGGTLVLPPSTGDAARRQLTPAPTPHKRASVNVANSTFGHATGEFGGNSRPVPRLRPSRAPLFIGIGIVAIGGAAIAIMQLGGTGTSSATRSTRKGTLSEERREERREDRRVEQPPQPLTFRVEIETDPRTARLELDGRPVGAGSLDQRLPSDGTEHVIVARAPGYKETTVHFVDNPPPHLLALDPIPVAQPNPPPKADPTPNIATPSYNDRPGKNGRGKKHAAVDHDTGRAGGKKRIVVDTDEGGGASNNSAGGGGNGKKRGGDSTTANGAPIID
jgi:serine/threonine-protein kinase